jgi:hypothetical protein
MGVGVDSQTRIEFGTIMHRYLGILIKSIGRQYVEKYLRIRTYIKNLLKLCAIQRESYGMYNGREGTFSLSNPHHLEKTINTNGTTHHLLFINSYCPPYKLM